MSEVRKRKIKVAINQDLTLSLVDAETGKKLSVFPKDADNPEKAKEAEEQFARMKIRFREQVKKQVDEIRQCYLHNTCIPLSEWNDIYLKNPQNSRIAELIVWMHLSPNNTQLFSLADGKYVDSDGTTLSLSDGSIAVAGAMTMSKQESGEWQQYFFIRKLRQPYLQVWEPIVHWTPESLRKQYAGVRISSKERAQLRTVLKNSGIEMHSDEMDKSFNHRTWKYTFSNQSSIHFGSCFRLDYSFSESDNTLTLGKGYSLVDKQTREMNKVLFELNRITMKAMVKADNDALLAQMDLGALTYAQISELLTLSIDLGKPRCTALLLNYKHVHFPHMEDIFEFGLEEWL